LENNNKYSINYIALVETKAFCFLQLGDTNKFKHLFRRVYIALGLFELKIEQEQLKNYICQNYGKDFWLEIIPDNFCL